MKLAMHLTYSHASLWGCTFKEACFVLVGFQGINVVLNVVTYLIVGTTLYTLIPGFILALFGTGPTLRLMGSIKKGKQEGYLSLKTKLLLGRYTRAPIPYVTRAGVWSTKRKVKNEQSV